MKENKTIYNTEWFIERAKKIHGDKYDYSKVDYVNNHTKVCIICPKHGEFWQIPMTHLKGGGCRKCANELSHKRQAKTTEYFINEAIKIHGNKYDYSKTEYINEKTKVLIICPIHGEFLQFPFNHLLGFGCKKCDNDSRRLNKETFIEKANKIHNGKYSYDKVEYVDRNTEVCITCPIHGDFWKKPSYHLIGKGCPMCAGAAIPYDNEKFAKVCNEIHHNKYDYSKVEYKNNTTKVCIICPIHGEFWQDPRHHLKGHGCPKCGVETVSGLKYKTAESFFEKANEIFKDLNGEPLYDYSKVEYKDRETKICIICKKHGEFWQTPTNHLNGQGCPKCASSLLEQIVLNHLVTEGFMIEFHKKFDWLSYKKPMSLDFYLPEYNIAIECQGIQHFKPIEYFQGEEGYQYNIARDKEKKRLCDEHGVKIYYFSNLGIEYPYEVFEDIDELIKTIKNE